MGGKPASLAAAMLRYLPLIAAIAPAWIMIRGHAQGSVAGGKRPGLP